MHPVNKVVIAQDQKRATTFFRTRELVNDCSFLTRTISAVVGHRLIVLLRINLKFVCLRRWSDREGKRATCQCAFVFIKLDSSWRADAVVMTININT